MEYLRAYIERIHGSWTPAQPEGELRNMLPAYLLNGAMHELGKDLAAHPVRLHIPLNGILSLLNMIEQK